MSIEIKTIIFNFHSPARPWHPARDVLRKRCRPEQHKGRKFRQCPINCCRRLPHTVSDTLTRDLQDYATYFQHYNMQVVFNSMWVAKVPVIWEPTQPRALQFEDLHNNRLLRHIKHHLMTTCISHCCMTCLHLVFKRICHDILLSQVGIELYESMKRSLNIWGIYQIYILLIWFISIFLLLISVITVQLSC